MNAEMIINTLIRDIPWAGKTCDTVKAGDPTKEVKKVAVSMFATVETVKKAKAWGADMLIVHEPTYYHHYEEDVGSAIALKKKKLIEESDLVIYRYHDHPHSGERALDLITEGEVKALGLTGEINRLPSLATAVMTLEKPISARTLAERMKNNLDIHFVRVAGETDYKATKLGLCFGTPGGMDKIIEDENIEIIMTGEINEWGLAERVRDAVALGMHKSLIVMTHIGSERDGMKLFTERFQERFPEIEAKYIECGEVYRTL